MRLVAIMGACFSPIEAAVATFALPCPPATFCLSADFSVQSLNGRDLGVYARVEGPKWEAKPKD